MKRNTKQILEEMTEYKNPVMHKFVNDLKNLCAHTVNNIPNYIIPKDCDNEIILLNMFKTTLATEIIRILFATLLEIQDQLIEDEHIKKIAQNYIDEVPRKLPCIDFFETSYSKFTINKTKEEKTC